MTNIERLVPHILNLVDETKWTRQTRLIALVAARTFLGNSLTQLGVAELLTYNEDGDEERARWDLVLLRRLARDHRVLEWYPRGGHPPAWAIAGEDANAVLGWRHVPWTVPRRHLVQEIQGAWLAAFVDPLAALAAQSPDLPTVEMPFRNWLAIPTREKVPQRPLASPREPLASPRFAGETALATASPPTGEEAVSGVDTSSLSLIPPSLLSSPPKSDGGREGQGQQPRKGWKLIEALEKATPLVFTGWPRDRLLSVADEPLAAEYLCAWVEGHDLRRYRTATGVVRVMVEQWERTGRSNAEQRAARAAELERLGADEITGGPAGSTEQADLAEQVRRLAEAKRVLRSEPRSEDRI